MSRKRCRKRKSVPAILRTPIECPKFGTEDAVAQQTDVRLEAIYGYCGVDRKAPSGAAQLIELMARELFPGGFKRVPGGTPRTKKPIWTWRAKNDLIDFMWNRTYAGMSQEEAARLYIKLDGHERSVKGLIAEFHRAEKWQRAGKLTDLEMRDAIEEAQDHMEQMAFDISRGK